MGLSALIPPRRDGVMVLHDQHRDWWATYAIDECALILGDYPYRHSGIKNWEISMMCVVLYHCAQRVLVALRPDICFPAAQAARTDTGSRLLGDHSPGTPHPCILVQIFDRGRSVHFTQSLS